MRVDMSPTMLTGPQFVGADRCGDFGVTCHERTAAARTTARSAVEGAEDCGR
jgi:hypothetical protein